MLKIRMQRVGRINMPAYRLIVVEHARGPKTGNIVEKVGTYNPRSKERQINADRVKYWISVGAKPTDTVHNMLISAGVITGKKINVLPKFVAPQKEESAPVEAAAPAPKAEAAPVEDAAPAEEVAAAEGEAQA
jgi:small subunit ribosomal protein S16